MSVFVDTSALLAVLHSGDENHARASRRFRALVESGEELVTTSYVLVETLALLRESLDRDPAGSLERAVALIEPFGLAERFEDPLARGSA